jgi:hypothetical protein
VAPGPQKTAFHPGETLASLVWEAGTRFETLTGPRGTLARVKAVLDPLAQSLGKATDGLTWFDVYDSNGDPAAGLEEIINELRRPADRPPERHEALKLEHRSNLTTIFMRVAAYFLGEDPQPDMDRASFIYRSLPDPLRVVWPHLPRAGRRPEMSREECQTLPLTRTSCYLLAALWTAVGRGRTTPQDLFVDRTPEIHSLCRSFCPPSRRTAVENAFTAVRRRLGLKKEPRKREFLEPEEFPPTLRRQWEVLEERGPKGLDANRELREGAALHKVDVGSLKERTLYDYRRCFGRGLFCILRSLPASRMQAAGFDLSVRDLMEVGEVVREYGAYQKTELANALVDVYRDHERDSDRSAAGKNPTFDSISFSHFKSAVKALAAYNGIFDLHERFDQAYVLTHDRKAVKGRKETKKALLDRPWVDGEIQRLAGEFYRIVKERSFERTGPESPVRRRHAESDANMRLLLFTVTLATLRYMGFRQQSVRICAVGKNIIFGRDGSVRFHYEEGEVKNEVEIDTLLAYEPDPERETHNLLVGLLRTYYRRVYPYVVRNAAHDLEGQFFVKLKPDGRFVRHQRDEAKFLVPGVPDSGGGKSGPSNRAHVHFTQYFKRGCLSHIRFKDKAVEANALLHPHFLRGLCADWLYYDHDVTIEYVAEFLGDTPFTIVKEYLREPKVKSGRRALRQAAENKKAEARRARQESDEQVSGQHMGQLTRQVSRLSDQVQALTAQVEEANRRAAEAEKDRAVLEARLAEKDLLIERVLSSRSQTV